jgi:hypothetical protein
MPRRDASKTEAEAIWAAEQLEGLSRQAAVRLARVYSPEPWIKSAIDLAGARDVLVLGRIDLLDQRSGIMWPACALVLVRRRSVNRSERTVLLSLYALEAGWRCQASGDGRVHMRNYKGDPDGPPSVVNGDYPWLMIDASVEAVDRGLSSLRAGPASS